MSRKSFALRISPDLYAALEGWAADDLRSVNAQIEYLLSQSVKKAGRWKEGTLAVLEASVPEASAADTEE
ncbi:hypothetical protein GCM10022631_31860 [Deinococcus rubellus]|uniref:CopG-like ribbon-helix-helix domain-containing protein n=1 Tax=Deinococcus rubellus TaxID=1889240 RepID=A0ABY5YHV8_9DEIO|nr:hypothetical protein [Deinococcus rubellus]UWX64698.1 hypothetical protein N0D28_03280 [Deinococcus rubellus]